MPNCGCLNKATFPKEVAHPVKYGTRLKSIAAYLNQYHLIPFYKLSETFVDLFSHRLSQSTPIDINCACYEILEPVDEAIKQQLIASLVICFDETGMRIEGKRKWCHVVSTENLTHYATNPHRGSEANEDMGILPVFSGTAMHDGWSSYFKFNCKHALCNSHHLRDLTFIHEEDKQNWAKNLIDQLIDIKATVDRRKPIYFNLGPAEINDFEDRVTVADQKTWEKRRRLKICWRDCKISERSSSVASLIKCRKVYDVLAHILSWRIGYEEVYRYVN